MYSFVAMVLFCFNTKGANETRKSSNPQGILPLLKQGEGKLPSLQEGKCPALIPRG